MNLKWIENFICIVDHQSITSAAKELYISPQALHQQMDLLEREVNCKLLIRSRKGVSLTNAGKALYAEAGSFLENYQNMLDHVKCAGKDEQNEIWIATAGLIQDNLFPHAIHAFSKSHPDFSVKYIHGSHVITPNADIVVNDIEYPKELYRLFNSVPVHFFAIMRSQHPLAQKRSLTIDELRSATIILPSEARLRQTDQTLWEYARKSLTTFTIEETDCSINSAITVATLMMSDKIQISCGRYDHLPSGLTQVCIRDLQADYKMLYNIEKAKRSAILNDCLTFFAQFYNEHWESAQSLEQEDSSFLC